MIDIKITTFKESGKYYDEWILTVDLPSNSSWYDVIKAVRLHKSSNSPKPAQSEMDWLIGIDDTRSDMYPIILKSRK